MSNFILYTDLPEKASAFTIGFNGGIGYFWGGYYSGSLGFAYDQYDNYAIMASQAGFLSGITAIAGDADPVSFNNIFLGANWSVGVGVEFTNFDHVEESKKFIQNIKFDIPITPLDIGFSYDVDFHDFKSFSIGISKGGVGRLSNEREETYVFAFTDKDIISLKNTLSKIYKRSKKLEANKKDFRFLFRNTDDNEIYNYYMWIIYIDYPKDYFLNTEAILTGDVHFEKYQIENYHLLKLIKKSDYYFRTINVK